MQKLSAKPGNFASFIQKLFSPNNLAWLPLVSILILAIALRLYQLGTETIWIDEHFSIRDAETLKLKPRLFYYLFLRFWMLFGESDGWLRLSSVPFSLGSIVLLYLLTLKVANRWAGLMAAFVMAVSPFFIASAQEIRMYSMSTFFSLLGTVALTDALEKITKKSILVWIISRLFSILATPINVLLIAPDLVLIFWKFKNNKKALLRIWKGLMIIGLIWLPFAYVLMEEMPKFLNDWIADNPKPNIFLLPIHLITFTALWPLKTLRLLVESSQTSPGVGWQELASFFYVFYNLILFVLLILGFLQAIKQVKRKLPQPKLLWIAVWAVLPFLILLAASYISGSLMIDRYLSFIAPYYFILLTVGFQFIFRNYRLMALGLVGVYLIAVTGGLTHYYTHLYRDDLKGIVALIEAEQQPGDAIGFYAPRWEPHLALPRYYKGSLPIQALANPKIRYPDKLNEKLVLEMLNLLPKNQSRYWLVLYHGTDVETIQSVFKEKHDILRHEVYPNAMQSTPQVLLIKPKTSKILK